MNWKFFLKAWLKVLASFGLICLIMWLIKCVILKASLDIAELTLAYLFFEAVKRYYKEYEQRRDTKQPQSLS